ncbi:hypothetical protein EDB80DRAFT_684264 [Ilyonectria destructans]|nr:hypothetical protein EDB80DRAFT_684264 [Ilyonectria destructans]
MACHQNASSMTAKSKEVSRDDQHNKSSSFGEGFLHSLAQVFQESYKSELPPAQVLKMEAEAKNILQQLGDTSGSVTRAINFEFTAYMVAPYRILKASDTSAPQIRQLLEDTL